MDIVWEIIAFDLNKPNAISLVRAISHKSTELLIIHNRYCIKTSVTFLSSTMSEHSSKKGTTMKKTQSLTDFATIEHISVTISQLNQDSTGKQVSNRTYWSIRKKIGKPCENTNNPLYKGSVVNAKSTSGDKREKQKPIGRFTQLSLFPKLK